MSLRLWLPALAALPLLTISPAAFAQALDTTGAEWSDAAASRKAPVWMAWQGCSTPVQPACARTSWLKYLDNMGLAELQAPPGGRVYRNLISRPDDWGARDALYVLTVQADGSGSISTPHRAKPYPLTAAEIAPFETALAKSDFGAYGPSDQAWDCLHGTFSLVEAVVDGRYRFAEWYCGVSSPSILAALNELTGLGAGKAGKRR